MLVGPNYAVRHVLGIVSHINKNLKAIIPIIEECGCEIHWNGKGDSRPDISWEIK